MVQAFASIGGNPAIFQTRQSRERREGSEETRRGKRSLPSASMEQGSEKRSKLAHASSSRVETPPRTLPSLPNFDVTSIPLPIVIEICMTALQSVTEEAIQERINMVGCLIIIHGLLLAHWELCMIWVIASTFGHFGRIHNDDGINFNQHPSTSFIRTRFSSIPTKARTSTPATYGYN